METTENHDLREARRAILSWHFMTFAASMFVFFFSFSIAIGVPETVRLDQPDLLQTVFISFVSAALFLARLFALTKQTVDKDRTDWLIVLGVTSAVLASTGLVVYRYYEVLLNITYMEAFTFTGWSVLGIAAMVVTTKLTLRLMLGKNYGV